MDDKSHTPSLGTLNSNSGPTLIVEDKKKDEKKALSAIG